MGFSARNDKERDQLIRALQLLELVETSAAHVARPARLRGFCRRGANGAERYLLIAAAEEHGLTLLHYDTDFDLIANITGQWRQWIVTGESID